MHFETCTRGSKNLKLLTLSGPLVAFRCFLKRRFLIKSMLNSQLCVVALCVNTHETFQNLFNNSPNFPKLKKDCFFIKLDVPCCQLALN